MEVGWFVILVRFVLGSNYWRGWILVLFLRYGYVDRLVRVLSKREVSGFIR